MKPSTFFENTSTVLTYSIPSTTILIIIIIVVATICLWKKRSASNGQVQTESYEMRRNPGERIWFTPNLPPVTNYTMSAPVLSSNNQLLSNSNRHFSKHSKNARRQRENAMSETNAYDTVSTLYSEPTGRLTYGTSLTSSNNLRLKSVHNRPPTRAASRNSMAISNKEIYGNNLVKSYVASGFGEGTGGSLNKGCTSN